MSSDLIEAPYNVRAVRDATDLDVGVSATVVATAAAEFWLGPTDVAVALAEGPGYRYVVSNLTDEVEIAPTEVGGTTYLLPIGVKVGIYCVPKNEDDAVIGKNPYLINEVEFGTTIDPTELPTAGEPGTEVNPWKVGDGVMAHVKDGTLVIAGSGAMNDFASAEDVPWAGVMSAVTAVTIENTVTHVGKNALAEFKDAVTVNGTSLATYRTVSAVETQINGMPLADYNAKVRFLNVGSELQTNLTPVPVPPEGAVTTWEALTNAIATAESGAVIAVGADIEEAGGELVVPKGKAVTIKLYGKTVTCGQVTVNGALTVGDADDSVGQIVASDGAKLAKSGSVTLLNGPLRGTFTTQSPGLVLLFK